MQFHNDFSASFEGTNKDGMQYQENRKENNKKNKKNKNKNKNKTMNTPNHQFGTIDEEKSKIESDNDEDMMTEEDMDDEDRNKMVKKGQKVNKLSEIFDRVIGVISDDSSSSSSSKSDDMGDDMGNDMGGDMNSDCKAKHFVLNMILCSNILPVAKQHAINYTDMEETGDDFVSTVRESIMQKHTIDNEVGGRMCAFFFKCFFFVCVVYVYVCVCMCMSMCCVCVCKRAA